jgi:hypothetical protein
MSSSSIYTTEPLATRALAAEIRHEPGRFIARVEEIMGAKRLGRLVDVRAEQGAGKIDVALTFVEPDFVLGIEAKFDHELTEDQVDRELAASQHLMVLLLDKSHAPEWLSSKLHVDVMTWEDAISCFVDSRLTLAEIRAVQTGKSAVTARLRTLMEPAKKLLGQDWELDSKRGGSGMPAINFYSPKIGDRQLRAVLQVAQRKMPPVGEPVPLRFTVGISVGISDGADLEHYPEDPAEVPAWVDSIRRLREQVIGDRVSELNLSTRKPSSAHTNTETFKGRAHIRKIAIADRYFKNERWLTTGYIDWIVGPASVRMPLEQVETLMQALVTILDQWFRVEIAAQQKSVSHRQSAS